MTTTPPEDPTAVPEPEPEPASTRGTWRRETAGRYLGGVAAGLARWLDLDPLIVRVALAVGAVVWPWIAVLYALAWLLVPAADSGRRLLFAMGQPAAAREAAGAAAIAVGVLVVLPDLGPGGSTSLQLGVLLVAAGVVLLARSRPGAPAADLRPPAPSGPPHEQGSGGGATVGPPPRSVASSRRHGDRVRPKPFLSPLTLSVLAVFVGAVAGLQLLDGRRLSPGSSVSVAMVIVGGALTVSAWWGRARALILLAPILVAGWVAFSLSDIPWYAGTGSVRYTPTSADDLVPYTHGVGTLRIDGADLDLSTGDEVTIDAAITAGRARVDVPADAALRITGDVGLGQVEVWDARAGGYYHRLFDSGLSANRRLDRRWDGLGPVCWESYEEPAAYGGEPPFDQEHFPAPTPTTTPRSATYETPDGEPCDPLASAPDAGTITVTLATGLGTLEVHRVDSRR